MAAANLVFANQTLREIVHTSVGSIHYYAFVCPSTYGTKTLDLASVHAAVRAAESAAAAAGRPPR